MRIAVANWTARRAGGVEAYLGLLIPALRSHGHEVFFWHELDEPTNREPISGALEGPRASLSDGGSTTALERLRAWRPDVLFVHRLDRPEHERALLAMAPGVFFVHGYHGTCISGTKTTTLPMAQPCTRVFGPMCLVHYFPRRCGGRSPLTMLSEYRRQTARLELLKQYASLVTFSEHMRREYLNHGFDQRRVTRLPAVDPMERVPLSHRTNENAPAGHTSVTRIAFVGRIDRLKGLDLLVQALPLIRKAVSGRLMLTVAGDGPDLARCQQLAATIGPQLVETEILFLGWASPEQCQAVLETTDVLAVPSVWPEPFGLVGIEAARHGVPVAAFRVGGIPEWLDDGRNGALAPASPPTAAGLAAAVARCLSPEIRRTTQIGATGIVDYSIDHHIAQLLPVLMEAGLK